MSANPPPKRISASKMMGSRMLLDARSPPGVAGVSALLLEYVARSDLGKATVTAMSVAFASRYFLIFEDKAGLLRSSNLEMRLL